MRVYTADEIIALGPCEEWPHDRICQLVGDGVTLRQIADYDGADHDERIWVLLRLAPRKAAILWACDCAERALLSEREAGRVPDPRSWRAIEVARDPQATEEDLRQAESAARSARSAARSAAAWGAVASERAWQRKRLLELAELEIVSEGSGVSS